MNIDAKFFGIIIFLVRKITGKVEKLFVKS